jgi:hypothetical protein
MKGEKKQHKYHRYSVLLSTLPNLITLGTKFAVPFSTGNWK